MNKAQTQLKALGELVKADNEAYQQAIKEKKNFAEAKTIYLRLKELNQIAEILSQGVLS